MNMAWITGANGLIENYLVQTRPRIFYRCKNFATASVRVRTCNFS
jgi:hypothetical protein